MIHEHPIFLAALTGFLTGIVLCVPVGPINLTIINEGARRGFVVALLIALGSTVMEVGYCTLAFTGFATLFQGRFVKAGLELFSFVFMLYLGLKFLLAKHLPGRTRIEERIETKLHPHSWFMVGLVRTMANPGVLLLWTILAATYITRQWVPANGAGKLACISGVAAGTALWLVGLGWAASLGHRKFSEKTLLRMEHMSGALLLALALLHGLHIIWELANQKM